MDIQGRDSVGCEAGGTFRRSTCLQHLHSSDTDAYHGSEKRRVPFAKSSNDHQLHAHNASHRQADEIQIAQTINNYITYSVIASTPALSYTSVLSTIRCFAVTSGPHEGSTFIQWSANFSSDADAGVIEDARFKRKEALADLASVVGKN